MSSAALTLPHLNEEEASNLVRVLKTLKNTLGQELALQAAISMSKIGILNVGHLLNNAGIEHMVKAQELVSVLSRQPLLPPNGKQALPDCGQKRETKVNTRLTLPAPCISAGCLPKNRCKTFRGIREHLGVKHGVSPAQAVAFAEAALLADTQRGKSLESPMQSQGSQPSPFHGSRVNTTFASAQSDNSSGSSHQIYTDAATTSDLPASENGLGPLIDFAYSQRTEASGSTTAEAMPQILHDPKQSMS